MQGYSLLSAPESSEMGAPVKKKVGVEVYGYSFNVKTDDGDEVKAVANFVDEKMRDLAKNLDVTSTSRLAIMAAMNIAEDYYRLKSEHDELSKAIDQKSARLIELVEKSEI